MGGLRPFETEHYFAQFEFSAPHLLAPSDCESITLSELLELSGGSMSDLGDLWLGYTEPQGNPELRTAIAAGYQSVDSRDVVVLNSPIEGIYLTMRTMLDHEDEAIVLMPAYDALPNLPADVGAVVRPWHLVESADSWQLDLDGLQSLLSDSTKLVVANFPHNPTGYLPTESEFLDFLRIVAESGAWLYHDEIFRGLEHGERPRLPSAADQTERSIVLGGLSKTHGLPGLRAGWLVVGDATARQAIMNTKMYTSICPPAPVEYLALQGVLAAETLAAKNRELVRANLELAAEFFARHTDLYRFRRPLAGPVGVAAIEVESAERYCQKLATEAGIMLLPAKYLGLDDQHVRFGFGRKTFPAALAAYDAYLSAE